MHPVIKPQLSKQERQTPRQTPQPLTPKPSVAHPALKNQPGRHQCHAHGMRTVNRQASMPCTQSTRRRPCHWPPGGSAQAARQSPCGCCRAAPSASLGVAMPARQRVAQRPTSYKCGHADPIEHPPSSTSSAASRAQLDDQPPSPLKQTHTTWVDHQQVQHIICYMQCPCSTAQFCGSTASTNARASSSKAVGYATHTQ